MGKKELADLLTNYFSGRTSEAIRRRLQKLNWRHPDLSSHAPDERTHNTTGVVENTSEPTGGGLTISTTLSDGAEAESGSGREIMEEEGWRRAMLETALEQLEDSRVESGSLKHIAYELLGNRLSIAQAAGKVENLTKKSMPLKWKVGQRKMVKRGRPQSNKDIRRARYAHIQRLYNLKRKDAANCVLKGQWREAYKGLDQEVDGVNEYWAKVYGTSSNDGEPGNKSQRETSAVKWTIITPITAEEISAALQGMRDTSAGMDRLTAKELLSWHVPSLAGLLNIILATEALPSSLAAARVTFLPKVECPTEPSDFRPIAITSILARALHKILARRMREELTFSSLQYAFLQRDGCLEASALLHAILRRSHEEVKPLAAAFLDVSKAFDTISHRAILGAGKRAGIPSPLLRYMNHLYADTTLHLGATITSCRKGVRQGDPLSPLLFILAMGEVLEEALPETGITLKEEHFGAVAYADDLILVADNPKLLQMKLDGLGRGLKQAGMSVNTRKSATLTILKDGRRKCVVLAPTTYQMDDGTIMAMGVADSQKYLGIHFGWKGRLTPKQTKETERMLQEISSAPLKPYQRLELVRNFMVPKLTHELVLGCAHRNTIAKIDKMIRRATRAWLRLPKDTSLGFLHAPQKQGGLGIPSLGTTIPLMQKRRFEKLLTSQYAISRALTELPSFNTTLRRVNLPCRIKKVVICAAKEADEEWAAVMRSSADGRSQITDDIDSASYLWVSKPSRVFPRLHLRGIQLRGGVLYTRARSSRGKDRSIEDTSCRGACHARETLNHILQICEITHDARCARHNRVVKLLEKMLKTKGEKIWVEPIIPAGKSFIKPDLILETGKQHLILDVSVVSNPRMEYTYRLKTEKYGSKENTGAIRAWMEKDAPLKHMPIIISGQGLMYGQSGRGLRNLGLTARDISDLCLLTIQGSLKCYDVYTRGT